MFSLFIQIESITFEVDTGPCDVLFRQFLSRFAGQLTTLVLDAPIRLSDLKVCNKLEELFLTTRAINRAINGQPSASLLAKAHRFLPNLKTLNAMKCLGPWSQMFAIEPRPLLTNVQLNCLHHVHAKSTQFNCQDLPLLWPNLRELNLAKTPSYFTVQSMVQIVSSILPQMSHLTKFHLPFPSVHNYPSLEELLQASDLEQQLIGGPVSVKFGKLVFNHPAIYGNHFSNGTFQCYYYNN